MSSATSDEDDATHPRSTVLSLQSRADTAVFIRRPDFAAATPPAATPEIPPSFDPSATIRSFRLSRHTHPPPLRTRPTTSPARDIPSPHFHPRTSIPALPSPHFHPRTSIPALPSPHSSPLLVFLLVPSEISQHPPRASMRTTDHRVASSERAPESTNRIRRAATPPRDGRHSSPSPGSHLVLALSSTASLGSDDSTPEYPTIDPQKVPTFLTGHNQRAPTARRHHPHPRETGASSIRTRVSVSRSPTARRRRMRRGARECNSRATCESARRTTRCSPLHGNAGRLPRRLARR